MHSDSPLAVSPRQAAEPEDPPPAPIATREIRLAAAADAAIARILSGDSRAFLEANRQTGGE